MNFSKTHKPLSTGTLNITKLLTGNFFKLFLATPKDTCTIQFKICSQNVFLARNKRK